MDYLIFLGICIVATASPGPAVFLSIKNGAKYGCGSALVGVVGNVVAMLTLASVSAAGLGAIILAFPSLHTAIKIIGGLYLIYLGIKAWCSKSVSHAKSPEGLSIFTPKKSKLFSESYFVGISNPKAIAFYTALFPQFINSDEPILFQFALLAGTFASCSFLFLMLYVLLASKLRRHLEKEKILAWFNRITGGVFVGFGVALVSSNEA
ncbi:LysE family translocator [Celerinatantimonas yamalensis]|uniref:LysE family translocator n=1 Tax=Celerinatantimonas yamalensis TaxID=559956 RepID=A0ABW9GBQ4_9GAMM